MSTTIEYNNQTIADAEDPVEITMKTKGKKMLSDVVVRGTGGGGGGNDELFFLPITLTEDPEPPYEISATLDSSVTAEAIVQAHTDGKAFVMIVDDGFGGILSTFANALASNWDNRITIPGTVSVEDATCSIIITLEPVENEYTISISAEMSNGLPQPVMITLQNQVVLPPQTTYVDIQNAVFSGRTISLTKEVSDPRTTALATPILSCSKYEEREREVVVHVFCTAPFDVGDGTIKTGVLKYDNGTEAWTYSEV